MFKILLNFFRNLFLNKKVRGNEIYLYEDYVIKIAANNFNRGLIFYDSIFNLKQEIKALKTLSSNKFFPKILHENLNYLILNNCGKVATSKQLITHKQDLKQIINILDKKKIIHRDLKKQNILFDGKKLVLIDFEWALVKGKGVKKPPSQTKHNHLSINSNKLLMDELYNSL